MVFYLTFGSDRLINLAYWGHQLATVCHSLVKCASSRSVIPRRRPAVSQLGHFPDSGYCFGLDGKRVTK